MRATAPRRACSIAPPDVGVELVVGSAHISEFGSRAAIAAASIVAKVSRGLGEAMVDQIVTAGRSRRM